MNEALARLIALTEFRVAGLVTRAVESVAGPVRVKSQEIVGEVVEATTRTLKTLLIKAALGLFAAVMTIIAVTYLASSLYVELLPSFGPVQARLIMAAVFVALAVVAVVAMLAWPKATPASAKVAVQAKAEAKRLSAEAETAAHEAASAAHSTAAGATSAPAPGTADLKSGFEAIIGALGAAGFRREQAGLRAGLALASQLRPMQIVSLVLVGGFVAGIRHTRRR